MKPGAELLLNLWRQQTILIKEFFLSIPGKICPNIYKEQVTILIMHTV